MNTVLSLKLLQYSGVSVPSALVTWMMEREGKQGLIIQSKGFIVIACTATCGARSVVLISFSKEVMWFVYLVCLLAG